MTFDAPVTMLTPFTRKFPQAHIIGNDISPIQPSWTLPNLEFIVENFEHEWLYSLNSFDFIHARLLAGYALFSAPTYDTHVSSGVLQIGQSSFSRFTSTLSPAAILRFKKVPCGLGVTMDLSRLTRHSSNTCRPSILQGVPPVENSTYTPNCETGSLTPALKT